VTTIERERRSVSKGAEAEAGKSDQRDWAVWWRPATPRLVAYAEEKPMKEGGETRGTDDVML
jgi:hypothetical protein